MIYGFYTNIFNYLKDLICPHKFNAKELENTLSIESLKCKICGLPGTQSWDQLHELEGVLSRILNDNVRRSIQKGDRWAEVCPKGERPYYQHSWIDGHKITNEEETRKCFCALCGIDRYQKG